MENRLALAWISTQSGLNLKYVCYLVWRLLHEIDKNWSLLSRLSPRMPKLFQDFHFLEELFVAEIFSVKDDSVRASQLVPVGRGVAVLKGTTGLDKAAVADTQTCRGAS